MLADRLKIDLYRCSLDVVDGDNSDFRVGKLQELFCKSSLSSGVADYTLMKLVIILFLTLLNIVMIIKM